jgi:C-terminal processing protease CtpA/Prc
MMRLLLAILFMLTLAAGPGYAVNSSANFGGVGIDGVPRADGTIVVRQLVEGGPAQLAGIRPGDIITQIDSTSTFGSDFKDMVEHHLRGRAGTPVLIKVSRPGTARPIIFRMIRRQLTLPEARKK